MYRFTDASCIQRDHAAGYGWQFNLSAAAPSAGAGAATPDGEPSDLTGSSATAAGPTLVTLRDAQEPTAPMRSTLSSTASRTAYACVKTASSRASTGGSGGGFHGFGLRLGNYGGGGGEFGFFLRGCEALQGVRRIGS